MGLKMRRLTYVGKKYGEMVFLDFPVGEGRAVISAGEVKLLLNGYLTLTVQRSEKYGLEASFNFFKRKSDSEDFIIRNSSRYNRVEIFIPCRDINGLAEKLEQIAAVLKKFYQNL